MNRFIVFLLLVVPCYTFAQKKDKVYKLIITTKSGQQMKGFLRELQDSTLTLSHRYKNDLEKETIFYKEIILIKTRERNAIGKGFLIGSSGGGAIGALIGFAMYEPSDCSGTPFCFDFGPGLDIAAGAIVGGIVGSLFGIAIGSRSKDITGTIDNDQYQQQLHKYLTTNNPR